MGVQDSRKHKIQPFKFFIIFILFFALMKWEWSVLQWCLKVSGIEIFTEKIKSWFKYELLHLLPISQFYGRDGVGWYHLFIIAENSAIYIYASKIIVWSFHPQIIIVFYKLKYVCLCARACMYLNLSRICDKLRLKLYDWFRIKSELDWSRLCHECSHYVHFVMQINDE